MKRGLAVVACALAAFVGAGEARATNECRGLMVCVPVAGPWVVVPTSTGVPRSVVEYQLTCPRGHVAAGLDAELSRRAIDVGFLGRLGSPVNPGISTSRSVVFVASFVGRSASHATFRPHVGCMPASGGGGGIPTSVTAFPPGEPTVRRVKTVRVRPGAATVAQGCRARERLVGAEHAIGFFTRRPPAAGLVSSVDASRVVSDGRVRVAVRGDAELGGTRVVVQVQAVCSRVS
ncbi:MAG: hypothetical protein ACRDPZ_05055 [Gaiellaceae bacterium]